MSQQKKELKRSTNQLFSPGITGIALIIPAVVTRGCGPDDTCKGSSYGITSSYPALIFFAICPSLIGLGISMIATCKFVSGWHFVAALLPAIAG